jgi:hypothetical protein
MCPSNKVIILYGKSGEMFRVNLNAREQKIFDLELRRLELESALWSVKEEICMYRVLYKNQ